MATSNCGKLEIGKARKKNVFNYLENEDFECLSSSRHQGSLQEKKNLNPIIGFAKLLK